MMDRYMRRVVVLAVASALLALHGCADERLLTVPEAEDGATNAAARAPESVVAALECAADVRAGTLSCQRSGPAVPADSRALIVGGQDEFVQLTSANVCYEAACAGGSPGEDVFQAEVSVRNLLGQALATENGTTPHAEGVRIFFHTGPTVTGGTGTVEVANEDGTATFMASGQPYFEYDDELGADEILSTEESSAVRTWQWSVPATVETFGFSVYVAAAVQDEAALGAVAPLQGLMAGGDLHTCALAADGQAWCWGLGTALGNGGFSNSDTPLEVDQTVDGGISFVALAAGSHGCGLTAGGQAYCWGFNRWGGLGDGTDVDSPTPVAVVQPPGVSFQAIVAGGGYTCAIATDGRAYCWGGNASGQLGTASAETCGPFDDVCSKSPLPVDGGHVWASLTSGDRHVCGVTTSGAAYCWGSNNAGQLGSAVVGGASPALVLGGHSWAFLVAGDSQTCGVTSSGETYCWGNSPSFYEPALVAGGHTFTQLALGGPHRCGLTAAGTAYCWGQNDVGQLGIGSTGGSVTDPTAVTGGLTFDLLIAGQSHTCGQTTAGAAYCWGDNDFGQLGDGNMGTNANAPVAVVAGGITWEAP